MWKYIAPVILASWWLLHKLRRKSPLSSIPGPRGLPLLGNILQIDSEKPHHSVTELAGSYGEVFKVNMLGLPIVVVSGREQLHEMLVRKGSDFAGRIDNVVIKHTSMDYAAINVSDPSYPEWQDIKKLLFSHIKGYGTGMKRIEAVTISSINDTIGHIKASRNLSDFDLMDSIQTAVLNIVYTLILGKKLTDSKHREQITYVGELTGQIVKPGIGSFWLDKFPWLRHLGHPTWKLACLIKKHMTETFEVWKQDSMENNDSEDFIQRIYKLQEERPEGRISEDHVKMNTWLLILAGHMTTSSTLSSLFHILADHKHIQNNLHREVDEILRDRDAAIEDKDEMPYTLACIYETLRLVPIVPLSIVHSAMKDATVGEYHIPRGTILWPNIWALHHDEKIWDAPFEFRPERFLDADGQLVAADHPSRKNTMAFGAGPRVCAGETFAMTRMFLILAQMMKNFEVLPASEGPEPFDCRDMVNGIVLMPKEFKVCLKRRN